MKLDSISNKLIENSDQIWNLKHIDQPSFISINHSKDEYSSLEKKLGIDLLNINNGPIDTWSKSIDLSYKLLVKEKYIIDKIIYKSSNTLSKEKSIQAMRKLKRVLKNLLDLDLDNIFNNIKSLSKSIENAAKSTPLICLPSREIFEYFFTRVYSAYQLVFYSLKLIKHDAFTNVYRSVRNAVFLPNNILFLSTFSRVYSICSKFRTDLAEIYDFLRLNLTNFKSTNNPDWSKDFDLEKFPLKLSPNIFMNGCDQKEKVDSKTELISEINMSIGGLLNNYEDVGDFIQREEEFKIEQTVISQPVVKSNFEKTFFRKIRLFLTDSLTENKFNRKFFKKKLKSYFKKKQSKNLDESLLFKKFVSDILSNKSQFQNDLNEIIFQDLNFKVKKILIKKMILKLIKITLK
jgi:hypothetical protein